MPSHQGVMLDVVPDRLLAIGLGHSAEPVELSQLTRAQVHWTTSKLPAISSACFDAPDCPCKIAVDGGSLTLSGVHSVPGSDKPVEATASGFVNGRWVSGKVYLNPANKAPGRHPRQMRMSAAKTALAQSKVAKATGGGQGAEKTALSAKEEEKEQYNLALKAVESHILKRQRKVEAEAKKIAAAVTRVITSPAVSRKIARLAMQAASVRGASPVYPLQAVEGAIGLAANSFGYAAQPPGAAAPSAQELSTALSNQVADRANDAVGGPVDLPQDAQQRLPPARQPRIALQGARLGTQLGDITSYRTTGGNGWMSKLDPQARRVRLDQQLARLKKVQLATGPEWGKTHKVLPDPWRAFSQFQQVVH